MKSKQIQILTIIATKTIMVGEHIYRDELWRLVCLHFNWCGILTFETILESLVTDGLIVDRMEGPIINDIVVTKKGFDTLQSNLDQ